MGIIVIAVFATFLYLLRLAVTQEIVQVVLRERLVAGKVTLCKLVYIQIVLAAQQVGDFLVVLGAVYLPFESACKGKFVGCIPACGERQVQVALVHVTLLLRILAAAVCLTVINIVETVPVYVLIARIVLCVVAPHLGSPGGLLRIGAVVVVIVHKVVAGQVAVVVGTRVGCIIPVQRGVAVPAAAVEQRGGYIQLVGGRCGVAQHSDGLKSLSHAGVADFAVLVAPVGVVHIGTHQVVNLLGRCVLRTSLAGVGKGEQRQTAVVVKLLLDAGVVREILVVHTVYPVVSAQAGRHVHSIGDAVVQQTGRIGGHQAQAVQGAVAQHAETPARTHRRRHAKDVGHAVEATHSKICRLHADGGLLATHGLVEAAPQAERRVTGHGIVHLYPRQIHILALALVAAVLEADAAETVARHVGKHIV